MGEKVYPVFELSDGDAASIDVHDGMVADWQEVLGEATLTTVDFGLPQSPGLDLRVWLGWHRSTSRLYVAMERVDDVFLNRFTSRVTDAGRLPSEGRAEYDMEPNDSYLRFVVDGDHSGSSYETWRCAGATDLYECLRRESAGTQVYELLGVTRAASAAHMRLRLHWNYDKEHPCFCLFPPYGDAGGAVFSENPYVAVTEAYVTLFHDLDYRDAGASTPATLQDGRTIGINLTTIDQDYESMPYPSQIMLAGNPYGPLADALLLKGSIGVEQEELPVDSWARIKATFAESTARLASWRVGGSGARRVDAGQALADDGGGRRGTCSPRE